MWKVWNEFCSRWEEERGLRSVLSEVSKITNATDTAFLALEEKESSTAPAGLVLSIQCFH